MKLIPKFTLNFHGYWRDCNKSGVPAESGVYLVYRCMYNADSDTVTLHELIYIGKSVDVNNRLQQHEQDQDFDGQCSKNETLCYSFAPVELAHLDIVENALIFAQKPRLNENLKDHYNHHHASFVLLGRCALMNYTDFKIG